ncbi:pyridoxamine 5'-phosphate oxidase family protein [Candidatus Bipolaricaulota bacterium]
MASKELRAACIDLMSSTDVAYLTTIGEGGYPNTRAMVNLRDRAHYPEKSHLYAGHDKDFLVYFSTNTSSRKRRQLEADARASVYFRSPGEYFGFALIGDVEIVDDMETKQAVWADDFARYYRTTGLPDDPDFTLLRLLPTEVRGWNRGEHFYFEVPA